MRLVGKSLRYFVETYLTKNNYMSVRSHLAALKSTYCLSASIFWKLLLVSIAAAALLTMVPLISFSLYMCIGVWVKQIQFLFLLYLTRLFQFQSVQIDFVWWREETGVHPI